MARKRWMVDLLSIINVLAVWPVGNHDRIFAGRFGTVYIAPDGSSIGYEGNGDILFKYEVILLIHVGFGQVADGVGHCGQESLML